MRVSSFHMSDPYVLNFKFYKFNILWLYYSKLQVPAKEYEKIEMKLKKYCRSCKTINIA